MVQWINRWINEWRNESIDEWINRWINTGPAGCGCGLAWTTGPSGCVVFRRVSISGRSTRASHRWSSWQPRRCQTRRSSWGPKRGWRACAGQRTRSRPPRPGGPGRSDRDYLCAKGRHNVSCHWRRNLLLIIIAFWKPRTIKYNYFRRVITTLGLWTESIVRI